MPVSKLNPSASLSTKAQKSKVSKTIVKTTKKSSLTIDMFDLKGKVTGTVNLPKEIFAAKINTALVAQAVRVYLANQRQGNASTKTRGEVNLTKAKAWRQKGLGRARHGAKSAPIWVGGGVAHGPRPHDFSLKMPQKMKRLALFSALTSRFKKGDIKIISGLEKIEPKTKAMGLVFKNIGFSGKKEKLILVLPEKTENIARAARNLKGVSMCLANQLNAYDALRGKALFFMKDAIPALEKTFLKN